MAFVVIEAPAAVDLSASDDTSAWIHDAPGAGHAFVGETWGRLGEAIASGGFTSAAGVASLELGGTEVATYSTGTTTAAAAIGDNVAFTPDGTNATAANSAYGLSNDDAIEGVTKTQGAGGTVTGTVIMYVPCDFNLG